MNLDFAPNHLQRATVAQISNLLYRRFPICGALERFKLLRWSHALPTRSRRYGRLEICATRLPRL
jgi:hypothetical protein